MRFIVRLFLLLFLICCSCGLSPQTIDACKKACLPNGVGTVTFNRCACSDHLQEACK